MNEKDQVYFSADDKEISEEDAARYQDALKEAREDCERRIEERRSDGFYDPIDHYTEWAETVRAQRAQATKEAREASEEKE